MTPERKKKLRVTINEPHAEMKWTQVTWLSVVVTTTVAAA